MSATENAELEDHFILYCDLLGFREASRKPEKMNHLLASLKELSEFRGDYTETPVPQPDGTTHTSFRAAASSFSDNIVISYPVATKSGADQLPAILRAEFLCIYHAGDLSRIALENGLLLRGGLTVGGLYHQNGIVFGDGLIEAYELESKIAVYPRIAISPKLIDYGHGAAGRQTIPLSSAIRGADGIYEVDYFESLRISFCRKYKKDLHDVEYRRSWWQQVMQVTLDQQAELRAAKNLRALAKWTWFQNEFMRRYGNSRSTA